MIIPNRIRLLTYTNLKLAINMKKLFDFQFRYLKICKNLCSIKLIFWNLIEIKNDKAFF